MTTALASAFTGEAELDAIMDVITNVPGVNEAEEAVFLGLVCAVVRATERCQAKQTNANPTNRLGERIGPHTAQLVMALASWAPHAAREFRAISGLDNTTVDATFGENEDTSNLGPIH